MTPVDTSSPEERARLVAEALADSEARDQRYRPPSEPPRDDRWKGLLALVLFVCAGVVAVAPPGWLATEPPPAVPDAARAVGASATVYLQAQAIEAFRQRHQRLPEDLSELPGALPGVRFVRSNDRVYQLVGRGPDGRTVVFDSTEPRLEPSAGTAALLRAVDES